MAQREPAGNRRPPHQRDQEQIEDAPAEQEADARDHVGFGPQQHQECREVRHGHRSNRQRPIAARPVAATVAEDLKVARAPSPERNTTRRNEALAGDGQEANGRPDRAVS